MSFGTYGIKKGAVVDVSDISIKYCYSSDRTPINNQSWTELTSSQIISPTYQPDNPNRQLSGLYNFQFPTSIFNQVGFYYVDIRPREFELTISDCGILASSSIKGIIVDTANFPIYAKKFIYNNALVGFKIEYINDDNIDGDFNIISSANFVEPINENLNNSSDKAIRYRLNDNSTLLFLTLVNSSSNPVKPSALPYLGTSGQKIQVSNTYFDNELIELELCDFDIKSVGTLLTGTRVTNCETGRTSYYDENNELYKQFDNTTVKDEFDEPKYVIYKESDTIVDEGIDDLI